MVKKKDLDVPPFTDKIPGKEGVLYLGRTPPPSPFMDKNRKVVFDVFPNFGANIGNFLWNLFQVIGGYPPASPPPLFKPIAHQKLLKQFAKKINKMESVTGVLRSFPKKHLEPIYFAQIIKEAVRRHCLWSTATFSPKVTELATNYQARTLERHQISWAEKELRMVKLQWSAQ